MVRGRGTGFFSIENEEDDIIIDRADLGGALDSDEVTIELKPAVAGERQAGVVTTVVSSAHLEFVGVVKERKEGAQNEYYLHPDNSRIHVSLVLPEAQKSDLGMKVVAKITAWEDKQTDPTGTIIETLGKAGDHETEMQAIIRSGGFSENFAAEIQEAADSLHHSQNDIFKNALNDPKRKDMRAVTTFTIDPHDAKDFDDALSIQTLDNGNLEVGIHIADVSHYVKEGDDIDDEARERATSIYLVDRVIPMLPEVLSNDLCSLRPNEDRLSFSAVFEIDHNTDIKNEWYGQTIIHSDTRFSYEDAQKVVDEESGPHATELLELMKHSRVLRKRRFQNGAIAFEQPEVKFELDESGKPIRAYTKERTETMMMIEDFMLLANQRVATYVNKLAKEKGQKPAFIYRIHDTPDPDRIEELAIFVQALGYHFPVENGQVEATAINNLLKEIEGKPEEDLLKTATIRSMAKAVYSTKNIGHFGLGFTYYTHFTSPIRRYPDLLAHRLLRKHLDGVEVTSSEIARVENLATHSSEREGVAVRAERNSIKYKQVEYMAPHVGDVFAGIVTGVTKWGIYVEEKESKSEGMIRLANLDGDYYELDQANYRVKGKRTGQTFSLGDEIKIKLTNADLEEKQLDFALAK